MLNSAVLFMLKFCLDQHMQIDGGKHVLITDLSVAPFVLEEAKEKTTSELLGHACAVQSL